MRDGSPVTYLAAQRVKASWATQSSLFAADRPGVWSKATVEDLKARFLDAPELGKGTFEEKLEQQFAHASADTVCLLAELMYVYELTPVAEAVGVRRKLAVIRRVLRIADAAPTDVPEDLVPGLNGGIARPGTWYLTRVDRQLAFLVRVARSLAEAPEAARRTALEGPWAFRELLDSVELDSGDNMRAALLHLFFPDTFESIISRADKIAILKHFSDVIPEPTGDNDRDLLLLRTALQLGPDQPYGFYRPPYDTWRRRPSRKGWLFSVGQGAASRWLTEGVVELDTSLSAPATDVSTTGDLRALLDAQAPQLDTAQRQQETVALHRMLVQVRPGHLVVIQVADGVVAGRVMSDDVAWAARAEGMRIVRRVSWINGEYPLPLDALTDAGKEGLVDVETLRPLGYYTDEIVQAATELVDNGQSGPESAEYSSDSTKPADLLPNPTQELAESLHVPLPWLSELLDVLRDRRRLILYGPPGTGKTYLAREIAKWVHERAGGQTRMVQFHPSYAYEDFFEGFRPVSGDGQTMRFELTPGPLKLIAAQAAANPGQPYILVIDEINRANLAKVFGELYFLLEYGTPGIPLQYSPTVTFTLPPNLFIMGTMNTADRSIALVDQAVRRRFDFIALFPGQPPLDTMLRSWLASQGRTASVADLLDRLNDRLGDPESAVGPSYFMSDRGASDEGLKRIWRTSIIPLLEERFAGRGVDVANEWSLDAVQSDGSKTDASVNTALADVDTGEVVGGAADEDLV